MHLINDSVSIVLLGDWNRLYIQPDWIADNVFECPEIEIGITGQGATFNVSYKKDKIVVKPRQEKVVFTTLDLQEESLQLLSKYVTNYLTKAHTPMLDAYGLNIDYVEQNDTILATVFDKMSDAEAILQMTYEIDTSQITRKLLKNGKIINMKCQLEHTTTKIHFNEHHANPQEVTIDTASIQNFIKETQDIVKGLGYEIEDE